MQNPPSSYIKKAVAILRDNPAADVSALLADGIRVHLSQLEPQSRLDGYLKHIADLMAFGRLQNCADKAFFEVLGAVEGHYVYGDLAELGIDDGLSPGERVALLASVAERAPEGREFPLLPVFEKIVPNCNDPNFFLYLGIQAYAPGEIDVKVTMDGAVLVHDLLQPDHEENFVLYPTRTTHGEHRLEVTSVRGQAQAVYSITQTALLHSAITYYYAERSVLGPELPPEFTIHSERKKWIPDFDVRLPR